MASKRLWSYIARLEKVIKATMESSDEIAELVAKINGEGVDISINCIALFTDPAGKTFAGKGEDGKKAREPRKKKGRKPAAPAARGTKSKRRAERRTGAHAPKFEVTPEDHEFLKKLGIRFD